MAILGRKHKIPLGIYIHVPFCRSKCSYCDFYSMANRDPKTFDTYVSTVCAHIKEAGNLAPGYQVDTVYFGGGTPTHLGAEGLATILTAVRRYFDVAADAEITFEANPDSVTDKLLSRLRSEGFNRVSLGIQTDDDTILEKIGRPHNYAQASAAAQRIRRAGFDNLSVDLIYGLPNQTLNGWIETLQHVLTLRPEHVSCYGLKVEPGTPLDRVKDISNLPDDDLQADMYLAAVEVLGNKGYRQYEISNFARRGLASKHNMKYWLGGEYLGFGPDASSDFAGKRFKIVRSLPKYVEGIKKGGQVLEEIEEIPLRERAGEYLMTRLRTTAGISREEYEKQYLLPFDPIEEGMKKLREHKLATQTDEGRWHLTPQGFLLSNGIIINLQELQDASVPLAKRR